LKKSKKIVTNLSFLRHKNVIMQMEELQIIERIQKGDTNAFSYLVTKYQDVVFSIALKVLKNRDDAEEVAQETFIKAFRSVSSFRGKSKFSTWLFSIAYNTCITSVRKKKFPTTSIDQVQLNDEEEDWDDFDLTGEERSKMLEMSLKKLPEDDYTLVILYYYEEQSIGDISRIVGLSESNVKVKLHRARKKLHLIMSDLMKKEIYLQP
jgi:RNA polymerase sigma factor (sigma-70 family)